MKFSQIVAAQMGWYVHTGPLCALQTYHLPPHYCEKQLGFEGQNNCSGTPHSSVEALLGVPAVTLLAQLCLSCTVKL